VIKKSINSSEKVKKVWFKKRKIHHFSDLPFEIRHQLEKLKARLSLGNPAQKAKSILMTSYNHGEGTSTLAAFFAECLAQDKNLNILLVDANTRTPSLHKLYIPKDSHKSLSFSDMLSEQTDGLALSKPSSYTNLHFVPCGEIIRHPSQDMNMKFFKNYSKNMQRLYDFVIFDSSPIGKYYDPIVVAAFLDGVILVVEAEKTPHGELRRAKEMLLDRKISILGVILNKCRFPIPRFLFERLFK
jgi:capsular exopolysaccharide synthesis family protein